MKKSITLCFIIILSSCKDQRREITKPKDIVIEGRLYHKDTTDRIIRDFDDRHTLIFDGIDLKNMNSPREAIQIFDLAEKEYGPKLAIYLNRGVCYDMIGEKLKAIKDFTKCLKLKGDYYVALQNRGLSYKSIFEYDKALIDLKKAILIDSLEPAGFLNLGVVYLAKFDYDNSCYNLNKSIELGYLNKYQDRMPENLMEKYCKEN